MANDELTDIIKHCTELQAQFAERNTMCDNMEKMFMLVWEKDRPTGDHVKFTVSPDARNAARGAINLMIGADPIFSIPYNKNNMEAQKKSEILEQGAAAMWDIGGRIRQRPVHYDAVTSAVLFSEMCIGVISTKDQLSWAKGGEKAAVKRMEAVASRTPFLFEVYDPRTCYPEFDELGLAAFHRRVTTLSGTIMDRWGNVATSQLDVKKRFVNTVLCEFWDTINHAVWIEGKEEPLLFEPHNLPIIPIVDQVIDGSMLWSKPEYQRQPLLYGLHESGLWNRQNLMLTVLYTLMFAIGSSGTFVFQTNDEGREVKPTYDVPGGYIKILSGESFTPLSKGIFDPALYQGVEIADHKAEESTLYRTALGQSVGANAPYSMVALLAQAGRLPLTSCQRMGSWGIAKALEIAYSLMKDAKMTAKIVGKDNLLNIKPADIPENMVIECTLDVQVPTDERQNAQIALELTNGDHQLTSRRYARETFLKIGQSKKMDDEIYQEKAEEVMAQVKFQQIIAKAQQAMEQQTQPPPGATTPGTPTATTGGPPMGGAQPPQGMPPELMAQMQAQQQATPGLPLAGPAAPMGEGPQGMGGVGGGAGRPPGGTQTPPFV